MNVLVLMGGMSTEREVSLSTGAAVRDALEAAGHTAPTYDLDPRAGRDIFDLVTSRSLRDADVVFIALHGGEGEDGRIQAMLGLMGVAYTGSGVRASSLCMDKAVSKIIFERHGIPTPAWACVENGSRSPEAVDQAVSAVGGLPVVTKPVDQGSSVGISIVLKPQDLAGAIRLAERYSTCVILEDYIEGRELSVPIVGDEVFPVVEVKPKQGFYDYERKYTKGMTLYECPAPIGDALFKRIQDDAMKAYTVLGCEGFGRVDVRLGRDDMPYFLEVNTIPGMTETSLVPMAAKASGISFPELIDRITLLALKTAGVENPKFGG
jgi:D-alanine-D-alanine ligase